jgi:sortase A
MAKKKKKSKWISALFMTIGVLLIFGAAGLTIYNIEEANRAARASSEILSQVEEQQPEGYSALPKEYGILNDQFKEMQTIEIEGREYIGTLEIPVLGLTLPVLSQWDYAGLKIAPGRYQGSVFTDDLIIAGHNYPRHFGNLKLLQAGDSVIFTDAEGTVWRYEVSQVEQLEGTDVEAMEQGEWDLTLFTCTIGGVNRVTVRCVRE